MQKMLCLCTNLHPVKFKMEYSHKEVYIDVLLTEMPAPPDCRVVGNVSELVCGKWRSLEREYVSIMIMSVLLKPNYF